jgi:hypothetical protein
MLRYSAYKYSETLVSDSQGRNYMGGGGGGGGGGGAPPPQCCNIVVSSGKFSNFNDTLVGKKICNWANNFT